MHRCFLTRTLRPFEGIQSILGVLTDYYYYLHTGTVALASKNALLKCPKTTRKQPFTSQTSRKTRLNSGIYSRTCRGLEESHFTKTFALSALMRSPLQRRPLTLFRTTYAITSFLMRPLLTLGKQTDHYGRVLCQTWFIKLQRWLYYHLS